jgi:hypothetical protein
MIPLSQLVGRPDGPGVERSTHLGDGPGGSRESGATDASNPAQDIMDGSHFAALLVAISAALAPTPPPTGGPALFSGLDGVGGSAEASAALRVDGDPGQSLNVEQSDTITLDPGRARGLARDFVPRLQRVVDRMWSEHGVRLDLVEGYRSHERQQELFAQGRSTPGPVVTWTQNSLHTAGSAADVYADGAPLSPDQAATLARVAREEGLRTLYPFDSGHIQMDRPGAPVDAEGDLGHSALGASGADARHARPLVAVPARVAPVARPARVARPGGDADLASADSRVPGESDIDPHARVIRHEGEAVVEGVRAAAPERQGRSRAAWATLATGPEASGTGSVTSSGLPDTAYGYGASGSSDRASGASSSEVTVAGGARRGSLEGDVHKAAYRRLRIPLEGLTGAASLDIGVRPGSVDATVNLSDPVLADELRTHLHELRRTLMEQGLEPRDLTVRVTRDPSEGPDSGRRHSAKDPERQHTGFGDERSHQNPFTQEEEHALIDR